MLLRGMNANKNVKAARNLSQQISCKQSRKEESGEMTEMIFQLMKIYYLELSDACGFRHLLPVAK